MTREIILLLRDKFFKLYKYIFRAYATANVDKFAGNNQLSISIFGVEYSKEKILKIN